MKSIAFFLFAAVLGALLVFVIARLRPAYPLPGRETPVSPTPTVFSLDVPPSRSLTAEIASLSGKVKWQSRTATQAAVLTHKQKLQQGENLETYKDGSVTFIFVGLGTISMKPNTKLEIIQTLPVNIVFTQNAGTVIYEKSGKLPLSVRTMHLLLRPERGTMTVTTNAKTETVRVTMASGSAQLAYEDGQNDTQTFNLNPEETLVYDDATREVTTF